MPDAVAVIAGTGTGVGKTWVGARLLEALLQAGVAVAARKPVQSFEPEAGQTDAQTLAAASREEPEAVCPRHRSLPRALAPPMAAEVLGLPPFSIEDLVGELDLPQDGVVLVEGVGGPRSPIASDGDTVALAEALDADLIVLVADPGLGAINAVALSREAFGNRRVVAFLNRFEREDDLHRRNREWLEQKLSVEVTTTIADLAGRVAALPPSRHRVRSGSVHVQ